MTLIDAIAVLGLLVLPLISGVVIARACLSRPQPTQPLCRSCSAPQDPLAAAGEAPCPSCGRRRAPDEPPDPARTHARPMPLVVCLLLVLTGAGGFAMSRTEPWRTRWGPRPDYPPTGALFATALRLQTRPALPIAELTLRHDEGEDVAASAMSAVNAAFDAQPPGQPLMNGAAEELAAIGLFGLPTRPRTGPVDAAFAERVLRMLYVEPTVTPEFIDGLVNGPIDGQARLKVAATGHQRLTTTRFDRVFRVVRVLVDGRGISIDGAPSDGIAEAPWVRSGLIPVKLPADAGTHRLRVECEALLYSPFDSKRLRDHAGALRPRDDWPQPLARIESVFERSIELPAASTSDPSPRPR